MEGWLGKACQGKLWVISPAMQANEDKLRWERSLESKIGARGMITEKTASDSWFTKRIMK
jgi:hypothetical protein